MKMMEKEGKWVTETGQNEMSKMSEWERYVKFWFKDAAPNCIIELINFRQPANTNVFGNKNFYEIGNY